MTGFGQQPVEDGGGVDQSVPTDFVSAAVPPEAGGDPGYPDNDSGAYGDEKYADPPSSQSGSENHLGGYSERLPGRFQPIKQVEPPHFQRGVSGDQRQNLLLSSDGSSGADSANSDVVNWSDRATGPVQPALVATSFKSRQMEANQDDFYRQKNVGVGFPERKDQPTKRRSSGHFTFNQPRPDAPQKPQGGNANSFDGSNTEVLRANDLAAVPDDDYAPSSSAHANFNGNQSPTKYNPNEMRRSDGARRPQHGGSNTFDRSDTDNGPRESTDDAVPTDDDNAFSRPMNANLNRNRAPPGSQVKPPPPPPYKQIWRATSVPTTSQPGNGEAGESLKHEAPAKQTVHRPRGSDFGQPPPQRQYVRNLGSQLSQQRHPTAGQRYQRPNTEKDTSDDVAASRQPPLLRSHRDRYYDESDGQNEATQSQRPAPRSRQRPTPNYQVAGTQNIMRTYQEYFPQPTNPRLRGSDWFNQAQTARSMQQYRPDRDLSPSGQLGFGDGGGDDDQAGSFLQNVPDATSYGWQEPMRRPYGIPQPGFRGSGGSDGGEANDDGPPGFRGDERPFRPFSPFSTGRRSSRPRQRPGRPEANSLQASRDTLNGNAGDGGMQLAMSNMYDPDPTSVPRRESQDDQLSSPPQLWRNGNDGAPPGQFFVGRTHQGKTRTRGGGSALQTRRTPLSNNGDILQSAVPPSDFDRRFQVVANERPINGAPQRRGLVSGRWGPPGKLNGPLTTEPGYVPVGKLRRFLYETSKLSGSSHQDTSGEAASTDGDSVEPGYGPPNAADSTDLEKTVNIGGSGGGGGSQDAT